MEGVQLESIEKREKEDKERGRADLSGLAL